MSQLLYAEEVLKQVIDLVARCSCCVMVMSMMMVPVTSTSLATITSLMSVMSVYMVMVSSLFSRSLLRCLTTAATTELACKALNQAWST